MPATRKVNHVSQEQDLDQLKNIFNNSSKPGQSLSSAQVQASSANSTVNTHAVSQITPEFDGEPEISKTSQTSSVEDLQKPQEQNPKVITEEKKEISDTTVGIRMSTAKKREMKAYFIQHGTTMSQGVLDAFTLLRKLEDKGLVEYKDGLLEIRNA